MSLREKGLEPPPKPDLGFEDLVDKKMEQFRSYMNTLDKWFRRMVDIVPKIQTTEITINPGSVPANDTDEQQFTVTGLSTADIVVVSKPTETPGLGIVGTRCSAEDTLEITFMNCTGSAIDAGEETYLLVAIRR